MKEDKTLTCCECGQEFVFTASEQEFYAEKGFTNEPRRCPTCRQARKQRMGIQTERSAATINVLCSPHLPKADFTVARGGRLNCSLAEAEKIVREAFAYYEGALTGWGPLPKSRKENV